MKKKVESAMLSPNYCTQLPPIIELIQTSIANFCAINCIIWAKACRLGFQHYDIFLKIYFN